MTKLPAPPLSYAGPPLFPFGPYCLVMESKDRTCDYFTGATEALPENENACLQWSLGNHFEPDPHNREAIASVLLHCVHHRTCLSVDIGANVGMISALMRSLGSRVVAVEGQQDLVAALNGTVGVNGWQETLFLHPGLATFEPDDKGKTRKVGGAWRFVNNKRPIPSWDAPFVYMPDVLLRPEFGGNRTLTLSK